MTCAESRHVLTAGLLAALAMTGCKPGTPEKNPDLRVEADEIRDEEGLILERDALPDPVRVDADTEFGATGQLVDADASPDGRWLAVTSIGTAHGAGWLVEGRGASAAPAAFQYGGAVGIGPWDPDGRFAVFTLEGPGPASRIVVADNRDPGPKVSDNARTVAVPEGMEDPESDYRALEWREGELVFEHAVRRWHFSPKSNESRRAP